MGRLERRVGTFMPPPRRVSSSGRAGGVLLAALVATVGGVASVSVLGGAACAGSRGGALRASNVPLKVELLASYDFPRDDPRSRELSGIVWDGASHRLYAISDSRPLIVPLVPDADYRAWSLAEPIAISVPGGWDGEGIALSPRGFFVATELGPHVYELDRSGATLAEVKLPEHFTRALRNRSLESLSVTPDGRFLFTANETALEGDGPQATVRDGTMLRIFRRDLGATKSADVEHAYRTDPVFAAGVSGEMGVSEILALSKTEVLVMERSYVPTVGNDVRLYLAALEGANVIGVEGIGGEAPVAKTLVLDFASLPAAHIGGAPNHLPNFEGLALGPTRPDGSRILFVISDDNGMAELVTRILVLVIRGLR
jgi:hypothetical protein